MRTCRSSYQTYVQKKRKTHTQLAPESSVGMMHFLFSETVGYLSLSGQNSPKVKTRKRCEPIKINFKTSQPHRRRKKTQRRRSKGSSVVLFCFFLLFVCFFLRIRTWPLVQLGWTPESPRLLWQLSPFVYFFFFYNVFHCSWRWRRRFVCMCLLVTVPNGRYGGW